MTDGLANRIAAFLDIHHVMSLATLGPDGPHAASLFYAREGLSLFWLSDPSSRHSRHIAAHPIVAGTIAPDYGDFPEIKGLQLTGSAREIVHPSDELRARELLGARYPFLRDVSTAPKALRDAYERARLYRFDPVQIVLIDNSRGFGSKETLDIAS
jgi:uncharacterized protein YhbP (UPF0306 family)